MPGRLEALSTELEQQVANRTIELLATQALAALIARRGEQVMFKPPAMDALRPLIERVARL